MEPSDMGSSALFSSTSINGGWINGVGVRADPSAGESPSLDVTGLVVADVAFPGLKPAPPAGVTGHEDADWALVRENHGLLLCRSIRPEEGVAPGAAACA